MSQFLGHQNSDKTEWTSAHFVMAMHVKFWFSLITSFLDNISSQSFLVFCPLILWVRTRNVQKKHLCRMQNLNKAITISCSCLRLACTSASRCYAADTFSLRWMYFSKRCNTSSNVFFCFLPSRLWQRCFHRSKATWKRGDCVVRFLEKH